MRKFMRCALLLSLSILLCTACAKEEQNELLQTEHIPGKEEAAVNTPTPIPSPTELPSLTEAPAITEAPSPTQSLDEDAMASQVTPLPVEEPEFMDMYRAMPAGTRVNTEGISEEEIQFCFCKTGMTNQTRTAFSGQAGLDWTDVRALDGIRVLYYRNDGKLYICDVIADAAECDNLLNCFYLLYQKGQAIENLSASLPADLSAQGYRADTLSAGSREYVYIYK